jgi:adenylate cyclase
MSRSPETHSAWLQTSEGERIDLGQTCSIGRSSSNDLVLRDEKISRKHALIHTQDQNAYWLVDFGSSNGTSINGRRVAQPTRLQNGDRVEIASVTLSFCQARARTTVAKSQMTAASTSHETRQSTCWLLFADIVSSTQLIKQFPEEEVPVVIGKWMLECKQIIEGNDGRINKYLGDGIFAFWTAAEATGEKVASALNDLRRLQAVSNLSFRLALHHGIVSIGGAPFRAEELMGRAVTFLFRMEKLGAKLQTPCLLSASARKNLNLSAARDLGEHSLGGFDGDFCFYGL